MRKKTLLLIVVLSTALIISIGLNILILQQRGSKLLNYSEIGLDALINSDWIEVTFTEENGRNVNLNLDAKTESEVKRIIEAGYYQEDHAIRPDAEAGSSHISHIRIVTSNGLYTIAGLGNTIRVSVNGEISHFRSDIWHKLCDICEQMIIEG